MSEMTIREQLLAELDGMTEDQLRDALEYIQIMKAMQLPAHYDPEHDPLVGFFKGSPDLAERSKRADA